MLDPVTGIPVSGPEAVKVLADMKTLVAFQNAGVQASEFRAAGKIVINNCFVTS